MGALCKLFSPGNLFCYAAVSGAYEVPILDKELDWIPITVNNLPKEYSCQYEENYILKIWRKYRHLELLENSLAPFVAEACKMALENQIEMLWLVLNSPSMLLIAEKVLEQTKLPATAIIWDPISSITEQGKMDSRSRKILEERSAIVVSRLKSCGVSSPGMARMFKEIKSDLPTRVLINAPCSIDSSAFEKDSAKLVIAFSGSLYARQEFLSFVSALNEMKWTLDGKDIELKIFSSAFDIPLDAQGGKSNVVFKGYLTERELLQELSFADVAYLPYWFSKNYAEGVKRCFPAKLATYVAAGCPVLYHGPKVSSPTEFLTRYQVGKGLHSNDPSKFKEVLRVLTQDSKFISEYSGQRKLALSEEIGPDLFKERFLQLVEIARSDSPLT